MEGPRDSVVVVVVRGGKSGAERCQRFWYVEAGEERKVVRFGESGYT